MKTMRIEFYHLRQAEAFVEAYEERSQGVNYPSRITSHNGSTSPISWSEEGAGAWVVHIIGETLPPEGEEV